MQRLYYVRSPYSIRVDVVDDVAEVFPFTGGERHREGICRECHDSRSFVLGTGLNQRGKALRALRTSKASLTEPVLRSRSIALRWTATDLTTLGFVCPGFWNFGNCLTCFSATIFLDSSWSNSMALRPISRIGAS